MASRDDGAVLVDPVQPIIAKTTVSFFSARTGQEVLDLDNLGLRAAALTATQGVKAQAWATDRERLHRFLTAHGGNPEKALATLRWCLDQRLQLRLWYVDLEEVREELALGKVYCRTLDKESHPVVLYRNSRADHTNDVNTRLRAFVMVLDHLEVCLDRGDFNGCSTWVVVLDLSGKPVRGSMTFEYLSRLIKLFMKCYPRRLYKCFILDANKIMNAFWSAACKMLEADTIRKICFVKRSTDVDGQCVVPELLEQIGAEKLEAEYGGQDTFEWDAVRHWRVPNLVPRVSEHRQQADDQLPLVQAAVQAVQETSSNCTSCISFAASPGAACGGHDPLMADAASLSGSDFRFFDARSEGTVTSVDLIVRDCSNLHTLIAGLPDDDALDPRLMRLRSDLARFTQDWDVGTVNAKTNEVEVLSHILHDAPPNDVQDRCNEPVKVHLRPVQGYQEEDHDVWASSLLTSHSALVAQVATATANTAALDGRLKVVLTISGTTLLFVVFLLTIWIFRMSTDVMMC